VEQSYDETMLGKIWPNGGEHGIEQDIKRNEMMAMSLPRLLDKKSFLEEQLLLLLWMLLRG